MIEVRFRCPLTWGAFAETGDPARRICPSCLKPVTDLSRLTREEAKTQFGPGTSACAWVTLDAKGAPLFSRLSRFASVAIPLLSAGPVFAEEPAPRDPVEVVDPRPQPAHPRPVEPRPDVPDPDLAAIDAYEEREARRLAEPRRFAGGVVFPHGWIPPEPETP